MNSKAPNMAAPVHVSPGLTEFDISGSRNGSSELVSDLIVDATHQVDAIVEDKKVPQTVIDNPVLVAVHVLAALLDYELGRIVPILERGCNALEQIAESVDFMAARPAGDDVPTEIESVVMYRALEADYMKSGHPLTSINEMDAALLRFKKLAGL